MSSGNDVYAQVLDGIFSMKQSILMLSRENRQLKEENAALKGVVESPPALEQKEDEPTT